MRALGSVCDRAVGLGLGALVLFAPLAFGSVETWALTIIETVILVLGAVWLVGRIAEGRGAGWLADRRLMIPIVAFVAIVLLQILPLPRGALSILSPRASSLYERTVPGYGSEKAANFEDWLLATDSVRGQIGEGSSGGSERAPVSYYPPSSRARLLQFVCYVVLFLVAVDRYRDLSRRRRMIVWTVFTGVGIAILGIFQKLTWSGKILWFRLMPNPLARPFGPFVNPNHFAGYMELIVPLALGLLLSLVLGSRARPVEDLREGPWGARWLPAQWRSREDEGNRRLPWTATNRGAKAVLLGFLFVLSIASIVLCLSRGGFLATLLTFILFTPLLVPRSLAAPRGVKSVAVMLALTITLLGIAFWLGSSVIAERAATVTSMQSDPSFLGRADTWFRTIGMFREHASIGVGLGAFETGFAGYYPPGTFGVWREAHNDYAQLLAEVGIIGIIPALLALYHFLRWHLARVVADRMRPERYLDLGLAMGVVSLFLHSLVDFNLQIPAVAVLFVLVSGMLTGSSPRASEDRRSSSRWADLACAGAIVGCLVLAVVAGIGGTRRALAEHAAKEVVEHVPAPVGEDAFARISRLAANQPRTLAQVGDSALSAFDVSSRPGDRARAPGLQLDMAETVYRRMVVVSPLSAWAWWGLGEVYSRRSRLEKESGSMALEQLTPQSEKDLGRKARLALAAFRTAVLLEPNSYEVRDDLALLYLQEGMRDAALKSYRESGRIMPLYFRHQYGPPENLDDDVFRAIASGMEDGLKDTNLVEGAEVHQCLGDASYIRGDFSEAERQYRLGLGVDSPPAQHDSLVYLLGQALRRQGKASEAATWLQQATGSEFVAWKAWVAIGDLRSDAGDHCGAFQAYSAARALAPPAEIYDPSVWAAREQAACGQVPEAIALLHQLLASRANPLEARLLLVHLLSDSGQFREALQEARTLASDAPDRREYRDLLAEVERRSTEGVVNVR